MMASNIELMSTLLADNVIWHPPTSVAAQFGSEVHGLKSVIAFLTENPEKFYKAGTRRAEILHVVSENDQVSLHFNFHAKPQIGGDLCTCANWLFELKETRIIAVWEILDLAEWNSAVLADTTNATY